MMGWWDLWGRSMGPWENRLEAITATAPTLTLGPQLIATCSCRRIRGKSTLPGTTQKMYSSGVLSDDNPKSLQRKVFIEVMLHFGRRWREGLRTMRHDSVVIKTDGIQWTDQKPFCNEGQVIWGAVANDGGPGTIYEQAEWPVRCILAAPECEVWRWEVVRKKGSWRKYLGRHDEEHFLGHRALTCLHKPLTESDKLHCAGWERVRVPRYLQCHWTPQWAPYVRRTPMEKRIEMSGTFTPMALKAVLMLKH